VLCKDGLGVSLNLTEGNGFKSSGALKAEGEAADTAKEVKDFEWLIHNHNFPGAAVVSVGITYSP